MKRSSYSQVVPIGEEHLVEAYFNHIYKDKPDILGMEDMAVMTGLSKRTFERVTKDGNMQFFENGCKYLFSKVNFMKFVRSRRFINTWSNSDEFIKILEDFKTWKQSR